MRTAAIFAGPEEGGRRRELRKAGGLWTLEEARETDSPGASTEECTPTDSLISAQGDLCQTSELQNNKVTNLCCFKPPSF